MSTKTNVYENWTGTTVTYGASPTTISIPEVVEIDVDKQAESGAWYADGNIYPTVIVSRKKRQKITIRGGAINLLGTIPENTPCTVVSILNDALNGTGSGAITVTAVNAIMVSNPFKGANSEFAMGDVTFDCFSVDGTTPPITQTVTS